LPVHPQQTGVVTTLPLLEQAAKGDGSVTPVVEGGIVRHVPMLFRLAGQRDEDIYPALSAESVRVAQGASTYLVRWSGAQGLEAFGERTGVSSIRVGQITIDTDAQGRMTLYDSGHKPSRFVSAKEVLKRRVPADKIDGQIVFVGTSAVGLKDLRNTPTQDSVAGVEIHAQIVEQMLSQTFSAGRFCPTARSSYISRQSVSLSCCCCRVFRRPLCHWWRWASSASASSCRGSSSPRSNCCSTRSIRRRRSP
jgi:adenylate cyclase